MNKRAIPRAKAKNIEKSASELERFEEPYWGETPKLTPEQIVEWLEGHREMMSLVKKSSGVPQKTNS
jgi:hypothetical protein